MSDFFELPPPPPEPPPPREYRVPDWVAPPANEVGVVVAAAMELVRTASIAVAIPGFTVFSTGLWFTLCLRHRGLIREKPIRIPIHPLERPDGLHFGVQFADRGKATTVEPLYPGEAPFPPHLAKRGVQGHGSRGFDAELWLWPLPPPGSLAFVVEWPEQGIPLTRRELDAQPILEAAARIEQLWPDDRLPAGPWTQVVG